MVDFEKAIYTGLGIIVGLAPKLYDIFVKRDISKDTYVINMLSQLSNESLALRTELREENDNLKEQVDLLYNEVTKVRDENFLLKKRINELEIELITLKSQKNANTNNNNNS